MKRSMKLALAVVLAAGTVLPALAQDNFPDAPANHWAYEALGKMKAEGLLVGYPDGLYRGTRPASRYELAVAMHAVYTNLKNLIDGMQTQLDALKGINPQDIQNLKDQVAALQNEVNAMKGYGDDIAALKRATEAFDKELKSLGVDVDAMKKDLGDLANRVTALEKRKPAVDISGDVNFWAETSNSADWHFNLNQDGRVGGTSGGAATGLFKDLAILHEGAFTFKGTNDTGPKWKGTIVVGNMMGVQGFGNQSSLSPGFGDEFPTHTAYSYSSGPEDVYVQDLEVQFGTSIMGAGFDVTAGRVGVKLDPYTYQRAKNVSYYDNERWDDGQYHLDGAILGFNFGSVNLKVFGGNNSNLLSVSGVDLNPLIVANNRIASGAGGGSEGLFGTLDTPVPSGAQMDQTAALNASFGLGQNGHVNLTYLLLQNNELAGANRDNVFGGNIDFAFSGVKVDGGYHVSDITNNTTAVNSHDNQEYHINLGYDRDRWGIGGGYRQIEANYFAPGDWGRLGILVNPANIKGFQAKGHFDITSALRVSGSGEWDKGVKDGLGSLFSSNSVIQNYNARLDYAVNPTLGVYGAYDYTRIADPSFAAPAQMGWTTFGVGYGLSSNAKLTLQYQFSNAFNIGLGGGGLPVSPNGRYEGGILTSQLSVKF